MRKIAIVAVLMLFVTTSGCAMVYRYGPYNGNVIDAETKEPLEGAAVLAVYYTLSYGPGGSSSHYIDAQETVTDNNGEFKIAANWIFTFRPLQSFEPFTWFTIFKPGYGCYPLHKETLPIFLPKGTLPDNKSVTIELPKLSMVS